MITWWIVGRRKPGMTQARYFYEWGVVHVALMLTTPSVMKVFRRYVQCYRVNDVPDGVLLHPQSPQGWDSIGVHSFTDKADMVESVTAPDYVARMAPHSFGDSEFVFEFTTREPAFDSGLVAADGALKVVNFLKAPAGMSAAEFTGIWRDEHTPTLLDATAGVVRRYVRNPAYSLAASIEDGTFRGTLFEKAEAGGFAGVEELWFDDLAGLARLRETDSIDRAVRASTSRFVDADGSFSMVVVEREPFRAVLDPGGGATHCWALGGLQVSSRHGEWTIAPPESLGALGAVEPAPVGAPG
ncbi:MAG: EthD domain-containing protein [Dermatophilaceae bacterium]